MNKNSLILIRLTSLIFIIGFIFSFSTHRVHAELRAVDVLASVIPENPKPYDNVNIALESFATDLNKATIEWRTGEKILFKNIGAKDFSFKMGALGTQSVIDIKITTVDGDIAQKRIVLTPTDMDILWQAVDSYVPPFYRGKAMPPREGAIKVISIPSGTKGTQTNNTTYIWKLNDITQQDQSGYKKNTFNFNLTTTEAEDTVEVVSGTISGASNSSGSLVISGLRPMIIFYKKSPTEGILYNNALSKEVSFSDDEMTIVGEPYFMEDTNKNDSHMYNWKINGEEISTPSKKNMLTIRPSSRGGYAKINLTIENTLKLFQSATQNLIINL